LTEKVRKNHPKEAAEFNAVIPGVSLQIIWNVFLHPIWRGPSG